MSEKHRILIEKTIDFVKEELTGAEGGHDWWHIQRVWNNALAIAKGEDCDILTVNLGALLHDIADSKFHGGDEEKGPKIATTFLRSLEVDESIILHVVNIIRNVSFKNTFGKQTFSSIELDIVRDADRLDAIGAIGIARTFNYGGHSGSEIFNPEVPPIDYKNKTEYKSSKSTTINHFYEKLLKIKKLIKTETGKRIAEGRHEFMESYLEQFFDEWKGIK